MSATWWIPRRGWDLASLTRERRWLDMLARLLRWPRRDGFVSVSRFSSIALPSPAGVVPAKPPRIRNVIDPRRMIVVFRKESRADSFQRQISALRQQLGSDQDDETFDDAEAMPDPDYDPTSVPRSNAAGVSFGEAPASRPPSDAGVGVIAANSFWNGDLRSDGSLHIYGRVQGQLSAADSIHIAEGAVVEARVAARTVVVAGSVRGAIECTSRLEVLPTGHVTGDVTSPTLVVHEGATVDGDLMMRPPDAPASRAG